NDDAPYRPLPDPAAGPSGRSRACRGRIRQPGIRRLQLRARRGGAGGGAGRIGEPGQHSAAGQARRAAHAAATGRWRQRRRSDPAPARAEVAPAAAGDVPLIQSFLRRWRRTPAQLDDALWQQVCRDCPWLRPLDDARIARLRGLVLLFLQRKAITPVAGLELDDAQRLLLAALCCLPLLEFGREGLHGWSELVVYPDAFRVRRSHTDAAGVLHEWDDE